MEPLFFLGTHHPHWLRTVEVPLFVSRRALTRYKTLPRRPRGALWALDSGGFTEIAMHGKWVTSAAHYAADVIRYRDEVGGLLFAAPQDWMCEPDMLKRTGLTVREHQARTIRSVEELRSLGAPVIPVLQGYAPHEYHEHVEAYERAGFDLRAEPLVGIGSVCRRQNMRVATELVTSIAARGIALHGFGFKTLGLRACGSSLRSADSLAWSLHARKRAPLPECTGRHARCNNCPIYALNWRRNLLRSLGAFDGFE